MITIPFSQYILSIQFTNGKNAMLAGFAAVFGFLLFLLLHFLMGDVQRNSRRLFQHKPLAPTQTRMFAPPRSIPISSRQNSFDMMLILAFLSMCYSPFNQKSYTDIRSSRKNLTMPILDMSAAFCRIQEPPSPKPQNGNPPPWRTETVHLLAPPPTQGGGASRSAPHR